MVKDSQSQIGGILMGTTDLIACFIHKMLEDCGGSAELQRCDLAHQFKCVPSQINYVISTRFSPEHGYIVESRRGGGGYIRITRVRQSCKQMMLMHTVNAIGEEIDCGSTKAFLSNLLSAQAIDRQTAAIMAAATGENALRTLPCPWRDRARASILKQMLIHMID